MPALMINPSSGVFKGDLFGFLPALPVTLFLAYWISAVPNRLVVVIGTFLGILAWVGTLIYATELPGASGTTTFFGSLFNCSIAGLDAAIIADLIVARLTRRSF